MDSWSKYMLDQLESGSPLIDLWPSQRTAISKGLLDGQSSLVLRMPTSAGKTKMTELAFVNDLYSDPVARCLYLAPFRALVAEVEKEIGGNLARLGFPVASLYGGSEANELEIELANIARVIIATPEKIAAVLRLSGESLADFNTIVLDEGHLIDSWSRGTSYEVQLAGLRSQLSQENRNIFLSAVLPNAAEIASWLGGSVESLAADEWQPTTIRIGLVKWPSEGSARLEYIPQPDQPLTENFFVPRLLVEEQWKEVHPETGRERKYVFPQIGKQGSIAAALAFQYADTGPVIIFSHRRDWGESIARTILQRLSLNKPIQTNLVTEENELSLTKLADYVETILGADSILARSISNGFAFHHGRIPQGIRLMIEGEFRRQTIKLLIATSTLAQGVNLPAKAVIVHSLPVSEASVRDFWNLAGRAGRAMKETEGEVIILKTGSLKQSTLSRFLNKENMETAYSRILLIAYELMRRYPKLSPEVVDELLKDEEHGSDWRECVKALDMSLLEVMAEDLALDETDEGFVAFVENLFATYQGERIDSEQGTKLKPTVSWFVESRRQYLLTKIPDGGKRKRFSRAGLSVKSCLALDEASAEIAGICNENDTLSEEVFSSIAEIICCTEELEGYNPNAISRVGYLWLNMGQYHEIYSGNKELFQTLDETVNFVEDVLRYRTPWVLNGIIRIFEQEELEVSDSNTVVLPEWFTLLPRQLHYGVPNKQLVWVMSLGVQDRNLAEWLLDKFVRDKKKQPQSFREFLRWSLKTKGAVIQQIEQKWPIYFSKLYSEILDRYERINALIP